MKNALILDSFDRRLRQLEIRVAALLAGASACSRDELLSELDLRIKRARETGDLDQYRKLRRIRDKHR